VGEEPQRTRRGDARVLLAERAGGGIARVGEDLAARRFLAFVERLEVGLGHVHFAADFDDLCPGEGRGPGRCVSSALRRSWAPAFAGVQLLRNVRNRPHIRRHILADRAVAARSGKHQLAPLVAKRAAQPVDLRLRRHRHERIRGKRQEALHPGDELLDLLRGKTILEAEHRPRVGDLGERAGRRGAEALRRRIRPHQLREALFELAVLADQRIIFGVGNLRRVGIVIELVVPRDLLRQPHQAVGGLGFGQLLSH